jgi:hypothetical protein
LEGCRRGEDLIGAVARFLQEQQGLVDVFLV